VIEIGGGEFRFDRLKEIDDGGDFQLRLHQHLQDGSWMKRELRVQLCERPRVQSFRPTLHVAPMS
jgi:hypothetical protein